MTTYQKCPECEPGGSYKCKWCDREGYVEIDDDSLMNKSAAPHQWFTVSVVFATEEHCEYKPVIGAGPANDRWDAYCIETANNCKMYLNFSEVQSIEISPYEEES